MKQDKLEHDNNIMVAFCMIILLGSFVGRKLVNVVKASINPTGRGRSLVC